MSSTNTRLITPPAEEELIYPYRHVWLSIWIEMGVLLGVTLSLIIITALINPPKDIWSNRYLLILLAILPLLLWSAFSWYGENTVPQPRDRLLPVVIITSLVASSIGVPLIENLDPAEWSRQSGLVERIIIATISLGILPETLKYLVVRYTVWGGFLRNRYDAVAYSVATAIGYSIILNLHYVLTDNPPLNIAAIRILNITYINIINSIIVAYGIAEVRLFRPSPFLMVSMISLASFITGLINILRENLLAPRLTIAISSPRLSVGFVISVTVSIAILLAMIFLFHSSERQSQEAEKES